MYCISNLLNRILCKLEFINPLYYRQLDDPDYRIDTYYIAINPNCYMVLYGACGECDRIVIYNNNKIKYDIMTKQGIANFVNNWDKTIDDACKIVFELDLDTFNGNDNDLMSFLTNSVKNAIAL